MPTDTPAYVPTNVSKNVTKDALRTCRQTVGQLGRQADSHRGPSEPSRQATHLAQTAQPPQPPPPRVRRASAAPQVDTRRRSAPSPRRREHTAVLAIGGRQRRRRPPGKSAALVGRQLGAHRPPAADTIADRRRPLTGDPTTNLHRCGQNGTVPDDAAERKNGIEIGVPRSLLYNAGISKRRGDKLIQIKCFTKRCVPVVYTTLGPRSQ